MKVLVVKEQGDRFDLPLAQQFTKSGISTRFVYKTGSSLIELQQRQGVSVNALPFLSRLDPWSLSGLRRIIRQFQPEVIHVHTARACFLVVLAQLTRKTGRLIFYRGAIRKFNPLSPSDWAIFRSKRIDLFHCQTRAVAESLAAMGVPQNRITVAPNIGYEPAQFQNIPVPPEFARRSCRYRIGAVANYRKVKGLEYLVDAAAILLERGLDIELFLIGKDEKKRLSSYVAKSKVRDRTRLTGPISNPAGVMSTFDCLVVPSLSESLGKVAVEAMACGVPVVATRVGGLPELIEHGKNGLLVAPANAKELADAVQIVLATPDLSEKLRENGLQTFKEKFTDERVAEHFLELYRRALKM